MGNAVRVLDVEDEALICSFIEDALLDRGFQACPVSSGEAAPSTFCDRRKGCPPLGDGITGWELARRVREITPAFPVICMTSASAPDWKSQGVAPDREALCAAQFAAAVSQLLDTAA